MPNFITLDTFKALAGLPLPDDVHTWTWERCARHSLRKWELISEFVDAERFTDEAYDIIRERYMCSVSCALCHRSQDEAGDTDCTKCPLAQSGYGCDEDESPWFNAMHRHSYRPMVHALRQAVIEARKLDAAQAELVKEGAD